MKPTKNYGCFLQALSKALSPQSTNHLIFFFLLYLSTPRIMIDLIDVIYPMVDLWISASFGHPMDSYSFH